MKNPIRHIDQFCPYCNTLLNATTSINNKKNNPKPGDFSICINCAEVIRFDQNLKLKKSSIEEAKFYNVAGLEETIGLVKDVINKRK